MCSGGALALALISQIVVPLRAEACLFISPGSLALARFRDG
jgi:hypothetical protein